MKYNNRWKKITENIEFNDGLFRTTMDWDYNGFFIKKGFSWNGVTRLPNFMTSKKLLRASMLHDFLLKFSPLSRFECALEFKIAMKYEGVNRLVAWTFYKIVRADDFVKVGV